MQTYVFITLCWLHGFSIVSGTLTPSGSVAVECGGQQAFTCSVTGQLAGWFMRGLVGIIETNSNGQVAASINTRVTTQDASGQVRTSTITIAGFTTADSGGTVSCVDSNTGTTQGTATVSVAAGPPSCPANVTSVAHDDNDAVTVTWSLPPTSPPVTSTTVTYCPTSSPNCGDSQVCTSPCTVRGLTANTEYRFTVTPANNCADSSSCSASETVARTNSTFYPSGMINLDCGGQKTFTCVVSELTVATWNITGLQGIMAAGSNGMLTAASNARISTTDTVADYTSSITISGFTIADSGGTVQCATQGGTQEGSATVVLRLPSCPANVSTIPDEDSTAVTVTWSLAPTSPPVTSTTVTYCPTSSPNCGDSQVCTSPCTVRGLTANTEYRFSVTPANNCGSRSCNGSTATAKTACVLQAQSVSSTPLMDLILAGVFPSVVLILINVISVVVAVLVTRHCYRKASTDRLKAVMSKQEQYEDVKMENAASVGMTDNPAYGNTETIRMTGNPSYGDMDYV